MFSARLARCWKARARSAWPSCQWYARFWPGWKVKSESLSPPTWRLLTTKIAWWTVHRQRLL